MIFADTAYFLALINPRDYLHAQALAFSQDEEIKLLTTTWVLVELGNAVSGLPFRSSFVKLAASITRSSETMIIRADEEGFWQGYDLYRQRTDKRWSLTDRISFLAMQEHNVTEALTADHHFSQAGFRVLLQN